MEHIYPELPKNWEMRVDKKSGKPYFVDHNTQTTSWVDPREIWSRPRSFPECEGNELPVGWEEAFDPVIGRYFINHNSWMTQIEDPRISHKNKGQGITKRYTGESNTTSKTKYVPGPKEKPIALRAKEEPNNVHIRRKHKKMQPSKQHSAYSDHAVLQLQIQSLQEDVKQTQEILSEKQQNRVPLKRPSSKSQFLAVPKSVQTHKSIPQGKDCHETVNIWDNGFPGHYREHALLMQLKETQLQWKMDRKFNHLRTKFMEQIHNLQLAMVRLRMTNQCEGSHKNLHTNEKKMQQLEIALAKLQQYRLEEGEAWEKTTTQMKNWVMSQNQSQTKMEASIQLLLNKVQLLENMIEVMKSEQSPLNEDDKEKEHQQTGKQFASGAKSLMDGATRVASSQDGATIGHKNSNNLPNIFSKSTILDVQSGAILRENEKIREKNAESNEINLNVDMKQSSHTVLKMKDTTKTEAQQNDHNLNPQEDEHRYSTEKLPEATKPKLLGNSFERKESSLDTNFETNSIPLRQRKNYGSTHPQDEWRKTVWIPENWHDLSKQIDALPQEKKTSLDMEMSKQAARLAELQCQVEERLRFLQKGKKVSCHNTNEEKTFRLKQGKFHPSSVEQDESWMHDATIRKLLELIDVEKDTFEKLRTKANQRVRELRYSQRKNPQGLSFHDKLAFFGTYGADIKDEGEIGVKPFGFKHQVDGTQDVKFEQTAC